MTTSSSASSTRSVTITALNVYPVKSCAGIALQRAQLTATGFTHDREWMIVQPNGRFVTQRESPSLALIRTAVQDGTLVLEAPESGSVRVDAGHGGPSIEVSIFNETYRGIDAGDGVARWLERYLGRPHRLVRFDKSAPRASSAKWTAGIEALNQFSDGFPWLLISEASLADLNRRLEQPLPMNRFRPNIVVAGLEAYEEDRVAALSSPIVALHPVKPCTRCVITTTDQRTGARDGEEPLRTLRTFRFDRELRGVAFGQNVIASRGIGEWLEVGQQLAVQHKKTASTDSPSPAKAGEG